MRPGAPDLSTTGDAAAGVGPRVLVLTDPAMERHAAPGHPERRERLAAVAAGVERGAAESGAELITRSPEPAGDAVILTVHDPEYLAALNEFDAKGGGWLDADTYLGEGSLAAARLAVGSAVEAAIAVARGEVRLAFAVVRPPGHHAAARRAGGFCLLNNVAIAAVALREAGLARRIAIVDWDVHHGDGTQELFDRDPDLLYASTHQRPLYPGTGSPDERGAEAGEGTMHNVTLPPGTDDEAFAAAWTERLIPEIRAYGPQAILVSAGYDGHRDDPLAHLELTEAGYGVVAEAVGAVAHELSLPGVALVLEGGYDLRALEVSVAATVSGALRSLEGGRETPPGLA
jgi:acetoin utilization deacetylase AcuC-like enzyme